ncbi:MAG: hypothetical protein JXA74_01795 [Anaerolineae bacterium]|nr:hypothetical protein [Anaerolineae bacterium]
MHPLDRPALYRITVAGRLESRWQAWFHSLTITHEVGTDGATLTVLTGLIDDQAALRGTLGQVWDLGLVVVSVMRMDARSSSGCTGMSTHEGVEP